MLGIDVGGTAIKALIVDSVGTVTAQTSRPTPGTVSGLVAAVAEVAAELGVGGVGVGGAGVGGTSDPIESVGVCVPGIVDETTGVGIKAANMPWSNTPLRDLFAAEIGLPVHLGHDVRCGARAEARWGAGSDNCLFVAIGTGIAAVPIVGGQPLPGIWAGEVGQPLVADPATGDLAPVERLASAAAIANRFRARCPGLIAESAGAKAVLELARSGNEEAVAIWAEAVFVLAEMLAFATSVTAPNQIVLAGGLALAGPALVDPLRAELGRRLGVIPAPELAVTRLGVNGQACGAAALTLATP